MSDNKLMAIVLTVTILVMGVIITAMVYTEAQTARFCIAAGSQWEDGACTGVDNR